MFLEATVGRQLVGKSLRGFGLANGYCAKLYFTKASFIRF